ncbi:MAG: hypothetical protein ACKN9U_13865, partial [Pirellulaceae bacterium]
MMMKAHTMHSAASLSYLALRTQIAMLICCMATFWLHAEEPLVIAHRGTSKATIELAEDATQWERQAADELAKTIEKITGALVPVHLGESSNPPADAPVFV